MARLTNPAKTAIRDRSVYQVAIRDRQDNVVHEFTTIANQAEVVEIVTAWINTLKDLGMGEGYSWSREMVMKRTN